ncbi:type VI secretion system baseplate subunit TssE [Teredinibacter turnerae]|uniref:Type VI secretion system lysozyme-related protein n=1 Tax=Teredinibacter turnerae (strain ATCC 39867 / T7901) TaxID=377629 RepID=C5BU01_TERTT|nr:type VI secretion system baseplate subunit TssE [Teredinibacter turnerae]ACR11888.1 type VI secretion system lysozyme-related protein [Teredinibacter turnerae T7901]
MARVEKTKNLRPSILDRLLDDDPRSPREPEVTKHQQLRNLRASVKRDLENLLNTRYRIVSPPENLKQLENSILNYGMPDLATVNVSDIEKRRAFTRELEQLLKTYEPRFKTVHVSYQDNSDTTDRTLRFRIDATLYADPSPEVIVFDSVLEPVSRAVNVEESPHV